MDESTAIIYSAYQSLLEDLHRMKMCVALVPYRDPRRVYRKYKTLDLARVTLEDAMFYVGNVGD